MNLFKISSNRNDFGDALNTKSIEALDTERYNQALDSFESELQNKCNLLEEKLVQLGFNLNNIQLLIKKMLDNLFTEGRAIVADIQIGDDISRDNRVKALREITKKNMKIVLNACLKQIAAKNSGEQKGSKASLATKDRQLFNNIKSFFPKYQEELNGIIETQISPFFYKAPHKVLRRSSSSENKKRPIVVLTQPKEIEDDVSSEISSKKRIAQEPVVMAELDFKFESYGINPNFKSVQESTKNFARQYGLYGHVSISEDTFFQEYKSIGMSEENALEKAKKRVKYENAVFNFFSEMEFGYLAAFWTRTDTFKGSTGTEYVQILSDFLAVLFSHDDECDGAPLPVEELIRINRRLQDILVGKLSKEDCHTGREDGMINIRHRLMACFRTRVDPNNELLDNKANELIDEYLSVFYKSMEEYLGATVWEASNRTLDLMGENAVKYPRVPMIEDYKIQRVATGAPMVIIDLLSAFIGIPKIRQSSTDDLRAETTDAKLASTYACNLIGVDNDCGSFDKELEKHKHKNLVDAFLEAKKENFLLIHAAKYLKEAKYLILNMDTGEIDFAMGLKEKSIIDAIEFGAQKATEFHEANMESFNFRINYMKERLKAKEAKIAKKYDEEVRHINEEYGKQILDAENGHNDFKNNQEKNLRIQKLQEAQNQEIEKSKGRMEKLKIDNERTREFIDMLVFFVLGNVYWTEMTGRYAANKRSDRSKVEQNLKIQLMARDYMWQSCSGNEFTVEDALNELQSSSQAT